MATPKKDGTKFDAELLVRHPHADQYKDHEGFPEWYEIEPYKTELAKEQAALDAAARNNKPN